MFAFIIAAFSSLCGSALLFGLCCAIAGTRTLKPATPCVIAAAVLSALCCGLIGVTMPFSITDAMPGVVFGCGFAGVFLAAAGIGFGNMDYDWRWFGKF